MTVIKIIHKEHKICVVVIKIIYKKREDICGKDEDKYT